MRVEVEAGAPESVETDVLAAPQLAAEPLSSRLAAFDGRLGDLLSRLVEAGEFAASIAWLLDDTLPLPPAEQACAIVDGTLLGSYDPGRRWKSAGDASRLERLIIVTSDEGAAEAAGRAGVVAAWANRARDL